MSGVSSEQLKFQVLDYCLMGAVVLISIAIGIYHAVSGGRQRTTAEYLVGNRHMKVIPVALSLLVSFQSAVLMIGFPAEMYMYGTMLWLFVLTAVPANVLSALLLVPLFHPLKLISAYEYLELRFKSGIVRRLGSIFGILSSVWYSGVVLYGPAITLEAVTGTPLWISIVVMAFAGIIYTTIGGYKAVIWTDVFQFLIMIGGMIAIIVTAILEVGGSSRMWDICERGGRIDFFNFDPDPTVRHTFWCLIIGGTIKKFGYNLGQSAIQRMSSMETVRSAQKIVLLAIPGFVTFGTLACLEGLLVYAYNADKGCDPLKAGYIQTSNQVFPYFVMVLFYRLPGIPGLFLSSIFSASLSTLSSNLSGISAIMSRDFIQAFFPNLTDFQTTVLAKISVLVFGVASVGVAFLASRTRGPLYQISSVLLSSFDGPLTGLFLLGAFFTVSTSKGAIGGGLVGFALTLWISMGGAFTDDMPTTPSLPSPGTEHCPNSSGVMNYTIPTTVSSIVNVTVETPSGLVKLYSLSYMWLTFVGISTTLIAGVLISYITGGNKPGEVEPAYLIPLCDRLCCCLPKSWRTCSRQGGQTLDAQGDEKSATSEKCTTEEKTANIGFLKTKDGNVELLAYKQ